MRAVLREAGWQAGFGKNGNTFESTHCSLLLILPAPAPALSVWIPMYYRVYQTLPASFSQNCSQCVGTLRPIPDDASDA